MILKLAVCFALLISGAFGQTGEQPLPPEQTLPTHLLRDSLKFYDAILRDPSSGQYCDAISLDPESGKPCNDPSVTNNADTERNSSVAATGMGIVSLAVSDQLGLNPNAYDEVVQSLRFLMGEGKIGDTNYVTKSSKDGWLRHWFDLRNGENNSYSIDDGYSTIDTAIASAAAQMAANYFEAVGKDDGGTLRKLADQLLLSVDWASAVANLEKGQLYLHYDINTGEPLGNPTATFNEYILVACVGRVAEARSGVNGLMTKFWDLHYADSKKLPRKNYGDVGLLTDNPANFISSFASQFATYLCASVNKNPTYIENLKNAQKADRKWFAEKKPKTQFWGLGAGEVRFKDPQNPKNIHHDYHADSIDNDPHMMVSPHIIAGFLPIYPQGIGDLIWMVRHKVCVYFYRGFELLWRQNIDEPDLPVDRLQAVDFSTMFMGLSTLDPRVGLVWFQRYAASRDTPVARAQIQSDNAN